jgi:futalosine hydrolase
MNILIAAATAIEIRPFLEYLKNRKEPCDIDVLITGIGLTAATYSLSKQFMLKKPELVIQAGVAGCFDLSIDLGEVVAIKQDTVADQSVVELKKLKTLFDLKLVPNDQFPYKKDWLVNPHKFPLKATRLKQVKGISVNQISTDKKMIQFYRESFNPVTESMEGAALHYVCLMENIPFIQLRSISNYIGERNKKKWDMQDSIKNLNTKLLELVEKIN